MRFAYLPSTVVFPQTIFGICNLYHRRIYPEKQRSAGVLACFWQNNSAGVLACTCRQRCIAKYRWRYIAGSRRERLRYILVHVAIYRKKRNCLPTPP